MKRFNRTRLNRKRLNVKKIVLLVSIVLSCSLLVFFYVTRSEEASSESILNDPIATVKLSTGDMFKIQLHPEQAPNTVNNFIYLADIGFYDGTRINRIVPQYLIQGGDPLGNGKGFPGYFIKSECHYNGSKNTLKHKKGTVSMARSDQFNTEGSQFFVLLQDDSGLNGQYSAFGTVIDGLESLEKLANEPVDSKNRPMHSLTIEQVTIDTLGVAYEVPQVLSVQEVLAQYE